MAVTQLSDVFQNYANKATGRLEGRMFVKIFRQAGLLNSKFTANDLDIIFVKHRARGERTLDLDSFDAAIKAVAKALALDYNALVDKVEKAGRPQYAGTDALPVRFYDDKSSYTGVHAHGGPSVG
ncbi:p25-alpha family protein [Babesia caballi]|uniref:P25-alpha family protein n=1 Tax=Babesia caballi TaxID=5871 RepID=A0AAV4LSW4_BABCB|nr:p25-alpha family protein [Babesia caballi]